MFFVVGKKDAKLVHVLGKTRDSFGKLFTTTVLSYKIITY